MALPPTQHNVDSFNGPQMVLGSLIAGWHGVNTLTKGKLNKFAVKTGAGLLGKGLKRIGKEHWVKPLAEIADGFSNEVLDGKDAKQSSAQKVIGNVTEALRDSIKAPTNGYSSNPNSNGIGRRYGNIKGKVDLRYL